jgi:hypothetical protein
MKIFLYTLELLELCLVLLAVKLALFNVTEFLPSTTTHSDVLAINVASFTVISAVE